MLAMKLLLSIIYAVLLACVDVADVVIGNAGNKAFDALYDVLAVIACIVDANF